MKKDVKNIRKLVSHLPERAVREETYGFLTGKVKRLSGSRFGEVLAEFLEEIPGRGSTSDPGYLMMIYELVQYLTLNNKLFPSGLYYNQHGYFIDRVRISDRPFKGRAFHETVRVTFPEYIGLMFSEEIHNDIMEEWRRYGK